MKYLQFCISAMGILLVCISNNCLAQNSTSAKPPEPEIGKTGQVTPLGARATLDAIEAHKANNFFEAKRLYTEGCRQNTAMACFEAGVLNKSATMGAHNIDNDEALRLYLRGCDLGAAPACNNAAKHIYDSKPMPSDLGRARVLYGRGCDLDSARACSNLALMAFGGTGGPVDAPLAAQIGEKACTLNGGLGCAVAGHLAFAGNGRPKDLVAAKRLFERGCFFEVANACTAITVLNMETKTKD